MLWLPLATFACLASPAQVQPVPKNFLIVLADDVGIDQLAFYDPWNGYSDAYPYPHTPHLAELAGDGVLFTQARAYPLCSPARAALFSGRYGLRTGCGYLVHGPMQGDATGSASFQEFCSPPSPVVPVLTQFLKPLGYATGLFGKLHLHLEPDDGGTGDTYAREVLHFDEYHGIARNPNSSPHPPLGPGVDIRDVSFTYYYWIDSTAGGTTRRVVHGPPNEYYDGPYATSFQRGAVEEWIAPPSEPFLAVWCPNDAHGPLQWPPESFDGDGHGFGDDDPECNPAFDGCNPGNCDPMTDTHYNTRLRAKIEYLDSSIGQLLNSMSPAVRARTYVLFLSDNGTQGADVGEHEIRYPPGHPNGADATCYSTAPYDPSHMKGTAYEQGVRIPLIVAGPGITPRTTAALVDIVDVYETVRQLALSSAGQPYAPSGNNDSISFVDVLNGAGPASHPRQISHSGIFRPNGPYPPAGLGRESQYYLRRDACNNLWKLVQRRDENGNPLPDELYNLRNDPRETSPLDTSTHPVYPLLRTEFQLLLDGETLANLGVDQPLACP